MDINFLAFFNREKPLAMYIFAKDHAVAQKFLDNTSSGGFVFNDTMMHAGCKFIVNMVILVSFPQTALWITCICFGFENNLNILKRGLA